MLKGQIDSMKTQIEKTIATSIATAINKLKTETSALILQFINLEIKSVITENSKNKLQMDKIS